MNVEELLTLHDEMTKAAKGLILAKNKDYGATDDVLGNFKRVDKRLRLEDASGLFVRIEDKIGRLQAFARNKGFQRNDEKIHDTAIDLVNYTVFLVALLSEIKDVEKI